MIGNKVKVEMINEHERDFTGIIIREGLQLYKDI